MSGKMHATVGLMVVAVVSSAIMTAQMGSVNKVILVELCIGAIIGSLMPDIDSSKSKASQKFNRACFFVIWAFFISTMAKEYFDIEFIDKFLGQGVDYVKGNIGLVLFIAITTLGKLSPHRQFTHKWFGTIVMFGICYIAFRPIFTIGFMSGYVLHILGDMITPAGRKDPWFFFDFKLPMQNSKGEFHYHF